MPIAVDNTTNTTGAGVTSVQAQHICTGTETNGILIVTVQMTDSALDDRTISAVTHNGKPLTHVNADADQASDGLRTEIWYRADPDTGGAQNIVVTAGGKCTDLSYGAISLTGVNSTVTQDTYYFDASDAGPTDSGGVWTNDANAFDQDGAIPSTFAYTLTDDSPLEGTGTTAPTTGDPIIFVEARVYGGGSQGKPSWTNWFKLLLPSGGWTWQRVNDLEVEFSRVESAAPSLWVLQAHFKHSGNLLLQIRHEDEPMLILDDAWAHKAEVRVSTGFGIQTATGSSVAPTLDITTTESSSYAIGSLASGESDGGKIAGAHSSIHKTDVGADTHAAQYVDAGGAGAQTMNYTDTDADTAWAMSAISVPVITRRIFVTVH